MKKIMLLLMAFIIANASEPCENLASKGWCFNPPRPKSAQAAYGNRDKRTTWFVGYWKNAQSGKCSLEIPSAGNSINCNSAASTYRRGGYIPNSKIEEECLCGANSPVINSKIALKTAPAQKENITEKKPKTDVPHKEDNNASPAQQERIAIIQTLDNRDSIGISELAYLTDRLREIAANVLPKQRYGVMTTESIVAFLGSVENVRKACNESSCLVEVGRKVSADYVAQARIGRFEGDLTIRTELYSSESGVMVASFTGSSKNMSGLLGIIDKKAPDLFKQMPR